MLDAVRKQPAKQVLHQERGRLLDPQSQARLAQAGRPIYPVAIPTSRRPALANWDRSTINLAFSRAGGVAAEPLSVPPDADEAPLEALRRLLQERLDAATRRAYQLVDQPYGKD